jgi:hypothetical protein
MTTLSALSMMMIALTLKATASVAVASVQRSTQFPKVAALIEGVKTALFMAEVEKGAVAMAWLQATAQEIAHLGWMQQMIRYS